MEHVGTAGGVCEAGASLEGRVSNGVISEDETGVPGTDAGSCVVEDVGSTTGGDGVSGS